VGGGESAVQPGSILSQARYGGTGDDTLIELAYLSNGSLALAGHYETSIDFGGGALPSAGGNDVFVAELDAFGNETRASRFGTSDEETLCGMAVDEADGVYLYGAYDATIDIGLGPLPTSSRGQFLSRFVNGAPVWNLALESIATHRPNCRAASSQANSVFIANLYETQFSIGSSTIAGNGQQVRPAGLARITGGNPAGPSWLRKVTGLGGAWSIEPVALSADPAGNVALLVEGATQYFPQQQVKPLDVSYDGTTISGTSGLNALFRIANDGSLTWHVDFANNDAKSVSTYPNGDILVCGVYSGSGGFAPGFSLPPAEARDVWAARYTAIGTLQWARRLGGSGIDGDDVKCEPSPSGSVIVAFTSDGPVDVGGLSDGGMSSSVVVAELDDSGIGQWLRRTVGAATLRTLAATGDEVAIGMTFSGELGFVALDTATTPGADILVARIAR